MQLSARGKSHRSRELFIRDAASTSAIISTEARNAKRSVPCDYDWMELWLLLWHHRCFHGVIECYLLAACDDHRLGQEKPTAKLLTPYFQRALAFERLKQIDRAIADYT